MENQLDFFDNFISHRGFDKFKKEFSSTYISPQNLEWIAEIVYDNVIEAKIITYTSEFYGEFGEDGAQPLVIFPEHLSEKINQEMVITLEKIDSFYKNLTHEQIRTHSDFLLKKAEKLLRQLSVYNEANKYPSISSALIFIKHFLLNDDDVADNVNNLNTINQDKKEVKLEKQNLLRLVGEAKIDIVVKLLLEYGVNGINADILLLTSRWHIVQRDFKNGILERDNYDLENNKIIQTLISFIKDLD